MWWAACRSRKVPTAAGNARSPRRSRSSPVAVLRADSSRSRPCRACAARFSASLGFDIEPETLDAIGAEAAHITQVSWERIGEEVTRILTEGGARRGFEIMDATGLLPQILPEIAAMHGVGPMAITRLRESLAEQGLALAGE